MNLFYLHQDANVNARFHNDKHVVKMCTEYAQLLSTAHRVLDGKEYYELSANNRRIKRWKLKGSREKHLYKASHINHPTNIWVRENSANYVYMLELYCNLLEEYTHRYGKVHGASKVLPYVMNLPKNIKDAKRKTPVPLAMPDHCKIGNALHSYREYYKVEKASFCTWKNRPTPSWFNWEVSL